MRELSMLRSERGLTQGEMANKLGISPATYCQYERGQRLIPCKIAEETAKILSTPMNDIFLPAKFTICKSLASDANEDG